MDFVNTHTSNVKDKLLSKLNGKYTEVASSPEEECVICVNAKAVMQTNPCGHKVVCRTCFVKTIQIALAQRTLPLRCVICRAKILRLKHSQNNKLSSVPPFRYRSTSCTASKRSSETVTSSHSLESNPWPKFSKYSRSLPGINGGSFRHRSSVNKFHSGGVYRRSSSSMRKCYRSCSVSSCVSDKYNKQKSPASECQKPSFEQRNCSRRRIRESPIDDVNDVPEDGSKSSELVSREKLIQQFQRDFKEGQLLSSTRPITTRNKTTPCKMSSATPKLMNSNTKPAKTNQKADSKFSNADKRKTAENLSIQVNPKYPEKQQTKTKDKLNAKTTKALKLEKKDKSKNSNECGKSVKNLEKKRKMIKNC